MNATQIKHTKLTATLNAAEAALDARKSALQIELGRELTWFEIDVLPEYEVYHKTLTEVNELEKATISKALAKAKKVCPLSYISFLKDVEASGLELNTFLLIYQSEIFGWALKLRS